MDKIVKKTNDFFESKWAMIIFSIIGILIAIIEITLFLTGVIEINGIEFGSGNEVTSFQKNFTALIVALALISLFLGFWSSVENTRRSNHAWLVALLSLILSLFLDIMAGLWMVTIEYTVAIILVLIRRGFWKSERYKEEKFALKNLWWLLVVVGIVSSVFFFSLVGFWGEEIYSLHFPGMVAPNKDMEWIWWLDAFTAALGVLGALSMLFRWRIAFLFWGIVVFPIMPAFFVNGNYIQIFQMLLWFIIDMAVVLAMTHQQKEYVNKDNV